MGRLSPTSMTRCLAVGCRECQCFQNRSCSTGTFSLSKTTITTLCKHNGHCDPSRGKGPRVWVCSLSLAPVALTFGLRFPHSMAMGSYPAAPFPWAPGRQG